MNRLKGSLHKGRTMRSSYQLPHLHDQEGRRLQQNQFGCQGRMPNTELLKYHYLSSLFMTCVTCTHCISHTVGPQTTTGDIKSSQQVSNQAHATPPYFSPLLNHLAHISVFRQYHSIYKRNLKILLHFNIYTKYLRQ